MDLGFTTNLNELIQDYEPLLKFGFKGNSEPKRKLIEITLIYSGSFDTDKISSTISSFGILCSNFLFNSFLFLIFSGTLFVKRSIKSINLGSSIIALLNIVFALTNESS